MTPNIHADLIREVLDADLDTSYAIIETLRKAGAPGEQCDRLHRLWLHRQHGKNIIADVFAGDWLIAITYRDGKREEADGPL